MSDPYAALRYRDFRLMLLGLLFSIFGGQMLDVAIAWELYERTGSAASLGLVGLAEGLPVMLFSIVAGHFSDHHSRRRILILTQIATIACSLGLVAVSHTRAPIALVYAILFLSGLSRTFRSPAASALVPQTVPIEAFTSAVTWRSSAFEISSMAGPMVGGLLIGYFKSYPLIYALNAACAAVYITCLCLLPERAASARAAAKMTTDTLLAGVRFIRGTPLILAAITLDLFAVLLGGATALLPIFAKDILHTDAVGLGWLRAAPAFGAFAMALTLAHLPARLSPLRRTGPSLLLTVAGFGVATIVFGLSHSFWLSMAMLFLTGAFDNVSVVIRQSLVTLNTPDEMRGRVASVNYIFIGASNELGAFESGMTAALVGPVASVIGGGIGTIFTVLAVNYAWPELRKLRRLEKS